jgi:hypothetical protein
MDLKGFALPPLVIATIACALYGFDAFETFSADQANAAPRALALNTNPPRPSATQLAAALPQPIQKVESIDPKPVISSPAKPAPLVRPLAATLDVSNAESASVTAIAINRVAAANPDSVDGDEDEENLVAGTNETAEQDQEPLIAAPPSMAAQATPVEMSDDGEIEAAAPENGG